jgi:predicted RNA methylase
MTNIADSSNEFDYKKSFETFLKHTDQKQVTKEWMTDFLDTLPEKNTFIDVGAGEGSSTKLYAHLFKQTICIEPNPLLAEKLKSNVPNAIIKPNV